MALGSLIGSFFGRTVSGVAEFAIGGAVEKTIEPELQVLTNEAWALATASGVNRPLDVAAAAEIVAEDVERLPWAETQAAHGGFGAEQLNAVIGAVLNAPGLAQLLDLWRRNLITDADFAHGLRKARMEGRWDGALTGLRDIRLAPADVANAVQQGFLPGAGLLPGAPGGGAPYTIPVEEVPLATLAEFAAHGVDPDRAKVLAELVGLPPGPMELLDMWRRGIITETSVEHGIREGHTKTKWTTAIKALKARVLSAETYAGLRLRGWITAAESYTGGALTGYSPEQMDKLYEVSGRPMTPHQMWLAIRRGNATRADFDRAIVQSNIRPEYAEWEWAIRYAYPSLFQLRTAVTSGSLTPARALVIMGYQGFEAQDAQSLVTAWAQGGAAGAKELTRAELSAEYEGRYITEAEYRAALTALGYTGPALDLEVHLGDARRVKTYRDAIVAELHGEYIAHDVDDADVQATLAEIGVNPEAVAGLLALWTIERRVHRRQLTAAQVKRGYKRGHITLTAAQGRLADLGYDAAETEVLLD